MEETLGNGQGKRKGGNPGDASRSVATNGCLRKNAHNRSRNWGQEENQGKKCLGGGKPINEIGKAFGIRGKGEFKKGKPALGKHQREGKKRRKPRSPKLMGGSRTGGGGPSKEEKRKKKGPWKEVRGWWEAIGWDGQGACSRGTTAGGFQEKDTRHHDPEREKTKLPKNCKRCQRKRKTNPKNNDLQEKIRGGAQHHPKDHPHQDATSDLAENIVIQTGELKKRLKTKCATSFVTTHKS